MKIILAAGTGQGPTTVSAFDAALMNAGVTNWNLIHLSSIIPPGSEIIHQPIETPESEYGQCRMVVMSYFFAIEPGAQAWSGIGWAQDETGKGIFVELRGASEEQVAEDIRLSLDSFKGRRRFPLGPNQSRLIGVTCKTEPVCALVVAVYPDIVPRWPE